MKTINTINSLYTLFNVSLSWNQVLWEQKLRGLLSGYHKTFHKQLLVWKSKNNNFKLQDSNMSG